MFGFILIGFGEFIGCPGSGFIEVIGFGRGLDDSLALSFLILSGEEEGEVGAEDSEAGAATGFWACMRISLICSKNINLRVV